MQATPFVSLSAIKLNSISVMALQLLVAVCLRSRFCKGRCRQDLPQYCRGGECVWARLGRHIAGEEQGAVLARGCVLFGSRTRCVPGSGVERG